MRWSLTARLIVSTATSGILALSSACTSLTGLAEPVDVGPGSEDGGDDAMLSCKQGEKVCGDACVALTDPAHGCGNPDCAPCAGANATSFSCKSGACVVEACAAGLGDCDRDTANGCEADLSGGNACGTCGKVCPSSAPICNAGTCESAAECLAPKQVCGTACVDVASSLTHCGAACVDCSAAQPAHTIASCQAGACVSPCATGYVDCNANLGDGCECGTGCRANACCPPLGCATGGDGGTDAADAADAAEADAAQATFTCPGSAPVAACSACLFYPYACVGCNGSVQLSRACAMPLDDCKNSFPNNYTYCPCQTAADCKYPTQTCIANLCRTCGETLATNNAQCKSGLTCDRQSGTCQ